MSLNVPVAIIFFARPDLLRQTFSAIRQNKPQKLFLIQDGPRPDKQDDIIKIQKCRDIVEHIDWDCEVYRNYSDVNLGCGKRVSTGVTWAFTYVDRLAIIEDDCVPSEGFFPFCSELLELYKDDLRIHMICGMNNLGIYEETPYDYFFSESGSIWGWATWKRVWDKVDYNLEVISDTYACKLLEAKYGKKLLADSVSMRNKINSNILTSSWSLQKGISAYLYSGLNIVPKSNLITNIGLGPEGANSVSSIKMIPRGLRRIYFMPTYAVTLPLKHPLYVISDVIYTRKLNKVMGSSNLFLRRYRWLESILYRLINLDQRLINRVTKLFYLK
jgi:hypothetical protein